MIGDIQRRDVGWRFSWRGSMDVQCPQRFGTSGKNDVAGAKEKMHVPLTAPPHWRCRVDLITWLGAEMQAARSRPFS